MGLGDVFDAIKAEMGDDTIIFVGPDRKDDSSRSNRIAWDPVSSQHVPAMRAGGGPGDDGDIAVRTWTVQVEFWGKTFELAEQIADRFYAAAHDLGTHFTFPPNAREAWSLGGVSAHGTKMTALLQVMTPVKRTVMPVFKPDFLVETPVIDPDG